MTNKMLVIHRTWYVGTGKSRPERAKEIVAEFKADLKEQTDSGPICPEHFLDVFVTCYGETNSRLDLHQIEIET